MKKSIQGKLKLYSDVLRTLDLHHVRGGAVPVSRAVCSEADCDPPKP